MHEADIGLIDDRGGIYKVGLRIRVFWSDPDMVFKMRLDPDTVLTIRLDQDTILIMRLDPDMVFTMRSYPDPADTVVKIWSDPNPV